MHVASRLEDAVSSPEIEAGGAEILGILLDAPKSGNGAVVDARDAQVCRRAPTRLATARPS